MNLFGSTRRALWCHGPRPEYEKDSDWADQWYIPARTLPLVRPRKDVVVLPGGNDQIREFAAFCARELGFDPAQIKWTSGRRYLLDEGICAELLPELRKITGHGRWTVIPYSVTPQFRAWSKEIGAAVFGDTESFVERFGNKGILHPEIGAPKPRFALGNRVPGLLIPKGFICASQPALRGAWGRLKDAGVDSLLLKPIYGATGEGIIRIANKEALEGYEFPMGPVALEELLPAETTCSVQFNGTAVFGAVTDQFVNGWCWEGNMAPSSMPPRLTTYTMMSASRILASLGEEGLRGPGGFDFVIARDRPYLVDVNLGRFTGAHIPKLFREMYAPNARLMSWKADPKVGVHEYGERLRARGIAFERNEGYGVFPICYLPEMWGMLAAFAESRDELDRLKCEADALL